MDKHEIAAVLGNIATLLELKGENPFKVRAYENAARIIEGLTDDIDTLIATGALTEIKGIGKNLAEHITELSKTGGLEEYEELRKSIPNGVILMLSIPGLGPKRVRFLWEKLKIKTVGELEMACKRKLLEGEPGFGEKLVANILIGIESLKRFAGKRLYAEAIAIAEEVHGEMKGWPEVIRSEIAGSIRRKKEVVKDIDILVATKEPAKVMERFIKLNSVEHVVQHGETKSEVILKNGMQCDLRAVETRQYPFALHYFTGSKEHNIAVRAIAKKNDCKLNEYGLFSGELEKPIACRDEAELFGALGLEYIEPELREDTGEIEASLKHRLPKLLGRRDLKGILHAHSSYTDGMDSIADMANEARRLGFDYLAICDHSKAVTVANGMKPADVERQHREINGLNKKSKRLRILKGIEVDIMADGSLDFDDDILSTFDIVIAAVHSRFGMKEDEMTDRIIKAISNPHVNVLAHPTGRLLLAREPYAVDLKKVIEAAAKNKVALEINSHPQRLDLDWRWCKYAKDLGVKFVICPDAHSKRGLSDIAYGINVARKGWLERGDVLNCLTAEDLIKYFKR